MTEQELRQSVKEEKAPIIQRTGTTTTHDKTLGDFVDWETVRVLCVDLEQTRDVGAVVSLLNRHDSDEICEVVEEELGGDGQ